MNVRWITPQLGTATFDAASGLPDIGIVDVRDLVDKAGNQLERVQEKIHEGLALLRQGKKAVVCCDHGISRSNAIAAGILARAENLPLTAAIKRVVEATGEGEIKIEMIHIVGAALGEKADNVVRTTRRVLLTGGSGFVGRALQRRPSSDMEIIAPPRSALDLELGSTQLYLAVREFSPDAVVHLARPRIFSSNAALGKTLTMLRNVQDVCVAGEIDLVYLSSWEIYSGYATESLLADESLAPYPRGVNGETALLAETLLKSCFRNHGLRFALLRCATTYGVGGDKPRFLCNFIEKAMRGASVTTHVYRNTLPAVDLLYIDDLVEAILRVLQHRYLGELNLGTGALTTTYRLAEQIFALCSQPADVRAIQVDGDTSCVAMDAARARESVGWTANIDVSEGLRRMVHAFRSEIG